MTAAVPPPSLEPLRAPERRHGLAALRLGQWYVLGGVVLGLLVVAALVQAALALGHNSDARNHLIDGVEPATLQALRMSSSVGAQESALTAYVATGDPGQLRAYREAIKAEDQASTSMRRLLSGVPGSMPVRSQVVALDAAAAAWRSGFADPVAADVPRAGRDALDPARDETGRRLFASFRAANVEQQRRLTALHTRTADALKAAADTLLWSVSAAAALVVLAAIILATLIRRTVIRPVGQLTDRVRLVAQGDFAHPLEISGPAEISELAEIIDSMRYRIIDEWRLTNQARELIDEQALELRRSNAELEQFAYVASHDLQEPLRKVASFCQMIERRYGDQLDERGKQYIDFAVDGAKRMQLLINDLLSFSRVGRCGRTEEAVGMQSVLDRALDNLSYRCEETSAEVTCDVLPEVTGDRTLLTQLFQNLIGNAVKFRGEEPPRVHIGTRFDGEMWEFSCTDNGIGIDARYADRIFLIFQRLHPQDEYTGTGIGLAMCKKIVEYHGGRIWLDVETMNTDREPTSTDREPTRSPGTTIRWTLPPSTPPVTGNGAAPEAGPEGEPEPVPDHRPTAEPGDGETRATAGHPADPSHTGDVNDERQTPADRSTAGRGRPR